MSNCTGTFFTEGSSTLERIQGISNLIQNFIITVGAVGGTVTIYWGLWDKYKANLQVLESPETSGIQKYDAAKAVRKDYKEDEKPEAGATSNLFTSLLRTVLKAGAARDTAKAMEEGPSEEIKKQKQREEDQERENKELAQIKKDMERASIASDSATGSGHRARRSAKTSSSSSAGEGSCKPDPPSGGKHECVVDGVMWASRVEDGKKKYYKWFSSENR